MALRYKKKSSENFQQVQHYIFLRNYIQIDFKKLTNGQHSKNFK